MRVMMIALNDIASNASLGVTKKILGQFHAFLNLGCDVYCLCLKDGCGALLHGEEVITLFPRKINAYFSCVKLLSMADSLCRKYGIELCYIRYPLADWVFMRMVKKLHKQCKVVVEIPTYPYDKQNENLKNLVARVNMVQDRFFRKRMKKYVNYISTFSADKTIYDIPCVNISNGIDISQIKYLGDQLEYKDDIHLIGVARLQRDHGYDRVIEGLKDYYERNPEHHRNIYFHIVGSGDAETELKELTSRYGLKKNVIFHGVKSGVELENLYLHSQIGVSFLAGFRSGLQKISALKNREYCAIGIPFIGSTLDPSISKEEKWYRIMDNVEGPIVMESVMAFFDYIKSNPQLHGQMREKAEKEFTWDYQLNKLILCLN